MAHIYSAVTILFGAIPATYLCLLPYGLVLLGFASIDAGNVDDGIKAFLYAAAAIYGTISLWIVAIRGPSKVVVGGLIVGTLAISPFTLTVFTSPLPFRGLDWQYDFLFVLPPLVAICWIFALAAARFTSTRSET